MKFTKLSLGLLFAASSLQAKNLPFWDLPEYNEADPKNLASITLGDTIVMPTRAAEKTVPQIQSDTLKFDTNIFKKTATEDGITLTVTSNNFSGDATCITVDAAVNSINVESHRRCCNIVLAKESISFLDLFKRQKALSKEQKQKGEGLRLAVESGILIPVQKQGVGQILFDKELFELSIKNDGTGVLTVKDGVKNGTKTSVAIRVGDLKNGVFYPFNIVIINTN